MGKCSTGELPESRITSRTDSSNPGCVTLILYSPRGTASNSNAPSESVCVVRDQVDVTDSVLTVAPPIGMCWGSWTIPRIFPKIVAREGGPDNQIAAASNRYTNFRIHLLHSRLESSVRGNEARLAEVQTAR